MRSVILVCLLAAAACSSDSTSPTTTFTVNGKWNATLVGSFTPGGSGVMSLTLSQNGTTVTGNGTFTDPADLPNGIMTVTGSVNGSTVALTIQVQPQQYMGRTVDANRPPKQFLGTLTATTMNGTLIEGGQTAVPLTANFKKQ